jgi:hypothetical protein
MIISLQLKYKLWRSPLRLHEADLDGESLALAPARAPVCDLAGSQFLWIEAYVIRVDVTLSQFTLLILAVFIMGHIYQK